MPRNAVISRIEVMFILVVGTLSLGVLASATTDQRATTQRASTRLTRCNANLRGIGQSMYIYAQDGDLFPAIGPFGGKSEGRMEIFDPKTRSNRPSTTGIPSPTVDLWALVRANNTTPRQFICPETNDKPDPARDPTDYFDFLGPEHLSYAYQFQHDRDRRVLGTSSEPIFPLMADANPYIKGQVKTSALEDRASKHRGNSTNHGKQRPGQNVLFQDGHVSFEKAPDVGMAGRSSRRTSASWGRDNCYTVFVRGTDKTFVDPGIAPTRTHCNLGGKSDGCLVP